MHYRFMVLFVIGYHKAVSTSARANQCLILTSRKILHRANSIGTNFPTSVDGAIARQILYPYDQRIMPFIWRMNSAPHNSITQTSKLITTSED